MTDTEKLIEKMDQRITRTEDLLHELVTQNMLTSQRIDETNKRIDANIEAMRQESAETNKRIDANIEAMHQESAETNKRIDATNKRMDETNRRMDEKFDIALKQNFMQGQQIQQQQIELAKMFKRTEKYYFEIRDKLDSLSDDVRNQIGFQPVTES